MVVVNANDRSLPTVSDHVISSSTGTTGPENAAVIRTEQLSPRNESAVIEPTGWRPPKHRDVA